MPSTARAALLVGVLVIAGIVGLQILDDSGASNETIGSVDTTTATSVDTTASSGATRPANEVRVKVYNASGVDGAGQVMSDKLKAQNWAVQEPATMKSASSGVVVQCVAGFENEAAQLANNVGQGAVVEPYPSSPPDGATDADCLVILGPT